MHTTLVDRVPVLYELVHCSILSLHIILLCILLVASSMYAYVHYELVL